MKHVVIILIAVLALIVAADAQARGALLVAHPPQHATLRQVAVSQKENIKHNRYVCRHGGGWNQIRSCKALVWLKREYNETEAKLHPRVAASSGPSWLVNAFICIHHYEGAWNANTGNGYEGGLQFGHAEWQRYGGMYASAAYLATPAQQIAAGIHYYYAAGNSFSPWPNTARACGLL